MNSSWLDQNSRTMSLDAVYFLINVKKFSGQGSPEKSTTRNISFIFYSKVTLSESCKSESTSPILIFTLLKTRKGSFWELWPSLLHQTQVSFIRLLSSCPQGHFHIPLHHIIYKDVMCSKNTVKIGLSDLGMKIYITARQQQRNVENLHSLLTSCGCIDFFFLCQDLVALETSAN